MYDIYIFKCTYAYVYVSPCIGVKLCSIYKCETLREFSSLVERYIYIYIYIYTYIIICIYTYHCIYTCISIFICAYNIYVGAQQSQYSYVYIIYIWIIYTFIILIHIYIFLHVQVRNLVACIGAKLFVSFALWYIYI